MKRWTIEDSKELYNINGWGTSYFGVNPKGDVYVTPCKDNTQIDLREVMDELALRDVTPPVLLRFPDILDNRIEKTWSLIVVLISCAWVAAPATKPKANKTIFFIPIFFYLIIYLLIHHLFSYSNSLHAHRCRDLLPQHVCRHEDHAAS